MAAESEVSFSELDGSTIRVGVLRTRWNDEHVSSLVEGIKVRHRERTTKTSYYITHVQYIPSKLFPEHNVYCNTNII